MPENINPIAAGLIDFLKVFGGISLPPRNNDSEINPLRTKFFNRENYFLNALGALNHTKIQDIRLQRTYSRRDTFNCASTQFQMINSVISDDDLCLRNGKALSNSLPRKVANRNNQIRLPCSKKGNRFPINHLNSRIL